MSHLALITGAGKRLGRAMAKGLAEAGCEIIVHYNSSQEEAENLANDIVEKGGKAMSVQFDQAKFEQIDEAFKTIHEFFGRAPDVLVNSASRFEWDDITTVTSDTLQNHFTTNLFGPVHLTRKMFGASTDLTRGMILNILDQKLENPNPDHLSYTLTKYGLQGFTDLMSRRLAPRFRVNAISPGYTLPDVSASDDLHFQQTHNNTPLERGPTPFDIAEAATYLLNATAVTGQTLNVDGGIRLVPSSRDFSKQ